MIEIKNFGGKLNKDDSFYAIPQGDYADALNITHDAIEGSNDLVVTNVVANRMIDNPYIIPLEKNVTIGAYGNVLRNTIIFFNWNESGYHSVLEYDNNTRTVNKIFLNLIDSNTDVLGFTETGKISSINIFNRDEGDLLFFLDSLGRPTFMNITLMKADTYNPVTRDILDVAKMPPLSPPSCIYGNDATRSVNYLRNRFFRFKYRWVYDDNFKSTTSPISQVAVPDKLLDEQTVNDPTKNNTIVVTLNSGGKDIKSIELLMSYVEKTNNWSDFQIVDTIIKANQGISDNQDFTYNFNNNSTYPVLDINESILLYDYIPKSAKCQELFNGNVLGYGGITDGYNKESTNISTIVTNYTVESASSGSLSASVQTSIPPQTNAVTRITFSGTPAPQTNIKISLKRISDNAIVQIGTYTTVQGDVIGNGSTGIISQLISSINSSGVPNVSAGFGSLFFITFHAENNTAPKYYSDFTLVEITPPTSSLTNNSYPVWKWSSERNVGIAYFDEKGVTNGIVYNQKLTFTPFGVSPSPSTGVLMPQVEMYINSRPPIWAKSYQVYFTKDETPFLIWCTNSVNLEENDFIYFDVTGLSENAKKFPTTAAVLSYNFQDGDRLRLLKPINVQIAYSTNYDTAILGLVVNPKINGFEKTGQFLKIKKNTFFSNSFFTPNQNQYIIEIYRPKQQNANNENKTYFECGQQFPILEPGTANRRHAGNNQDQSADLSSQAISIFKQGDVYYRQRQIALSDTQTNTGYATFFVVDRNIIDSYISAVSSLEGRPNLIDINAREAYYGATIRHGQAYQPNTNVNGLNRFYPEDFLDVDYSYGSIQRLKTRDRLVRVFQELKIGSIPLFSKIGKSPTGDELVISTNSLLNPVQYYMGDWGIGTCPESLASFNFADYFCDNKRGAICRVSNDGVTPLSILYKMNSWANNELPLRKGNYKIYGAFEQRQNNYVIALEETNTSEAYTLSFDEERNSFDSFLSYKPEMMCPLGVLFVTFKNGVPWTHDDEPYYNNFYGVQYDSRIKGVFNKDSFMKKTYISISEMASQVWYCPSIETSSKSYGNTKQSSNLIQSDFSNFEDNFYASLLRDVNSLGGINNGDYLKGNWISILFEAKSNNYPLNNLISLGAVSLKYNDSPLNNR